MRTARIALLPALAAFAWALPQAAQAQLASGLAGSMGSTVGPDGALYVPESALGRITRIDPKTGATSTFAVGLPPTQPGAPFGGAVDVAFLGGTAYALVTMVDEFLGGDDVVGIYRVDASGNHEPIADIGGQTMFALSQGTWDGAFPGSPANPGEGSLVRANPDGSFGVVADGLDRPSSLEIIGNTAYVVTLLGEVWAIDDISGPPFGKAR